MLKLFVLSLSMLFVLGCGRSDSSDSSDLVRQADEGLSGVRYICVGDSTRANSELFYEVQEGLSHSGVQSVLMARYGQSLSDFNHGNAYPTTRDVIYNIPGNGEHTIVDISLGINDRYHDGSTIKRDLIQAIEKIREYRPETNFVLTTPNRLYYDDASTQKLRNVYHDVANEMYLGLNTVVDSLMPSVSATPYSWYQEDGIHLSSEGQHQVAQFILRNMRGY
jgi:lysophospholipase L1-like esterase